MPENQDHPWGESHSQNHQVTDIVALIEGKIEALPEEQRATAIENIKKIANEKGAGTAAIMKNVLGLIIGVAK